MKTAKRLLCIIIAALFCVTALVGCKKDGETAESDTQSLSVSTEAPSSDEGLETKDTLGEYDFNGKEFKILYNSETLYEIDSANEKNAAKVNDAVYERNHAVEKRFNVKISYDTIAGNYASRTEFKSALESANADASMPYSAATGSISTLAMVAVDGQTMNMLSLSEIDMNKAWWSSHFYKNGQIDGCLFMGVGDIAHSMYNYMQVVYVNEELAESYLKDDSGKKIDLYALVENGEWTYEKLKTYTKLVNYTNDQKYGLLLNGHSARNFTAALDVELAVMNPSTGRYSFPETIPERSGTIIDDFTNFASSIENVYYKVNTGDDAGACNKLFNDGKAIFYTQNLGEAKKLTKTFRIMPFPKYEEGTDTEYYTSIHDKMTAVCVPMAVKDREFTGVILEALCMYGYQEVRPAYYEGVLQQRVLGEYDQAQMLDFIRSTLTIKFELIYNYSLGFPYSIMSDKTYDPTTGTKLTATDAWNAHYTLWNTNLQNQIYKKLK